MMVGAHFARRFAGRSIPRDWAEQVIDQIWPALAAPSSARIVARTVALSRASWFHETR